MLFGGAEIGCSDDEIYSSERIGRCRSGCLVLAVPHVAAHFPPPFPQMRARPEGETRREMIDTRGATASANHHQHTASPQPGLGD